MQRSSSSRASDTISEAKVVRYPECMSLSWWRGCSTRFFETPDLAGALDSPGTGLEAHASQAAAVRRRVAGTQPLDPFNFTAARMSAFNALRLIFSPSRKSMARLVFPSRLELKRPEGSFSEAPLANVIFTTSL